MPPMSSLCLCLCLCLSFGCIENFDCRECHAYHAKIPKKDYKSYSRIIGERVYDKHFRALYLLVSQNETCESCLYQQYGVKQGF